MRKTALMKGGKLLFEFKELLGEAIVLVPIVHVVAIHMPEVLDLDGGPIGFRKLLNAEVTETSSVKEHRASFSEPFARFPDHKFEVGIEVEPVDLVGDLIGFEVSE